MFREMTQSPEQPPQDTVSQLSGLMFERKEADALALVKRLADVLMTSPDGHTILGLACAWNCPLVVDYLLKDRKVSVDLPNAAGITPLMAACRHGRFELVNYLIGENADLLAQSKSGDTALIYAIESGNLSIVKLLIEKNVSPFLIQSSTGFSMARLAELESYPEIAGYLRTLGVS